jgi:ribokinase
VPRVVVVGDLMTLVAGRVRRFPVPGENVVLEDTRTYSSGVAANIALNLRALGVDVTVLGAVGADAAGEQVLSELRDGGVDTAAVLRTSGTPTASMVVLVEPSGERTMIGTRGASERFELDAERAIDGPGGGGPAWLHVSGYTLLDPEMEGRCDAIVSAAEERGIPCSVDLEGIGTSGRRTSLDRLLTFCNQDEFRGYFGTDDPEVVATRTSPLVLKAGSEGCYLVGSGRVLQVAVVPVGDPTDATGAGDAFDAAFIAASLRGFDAERACRSGNAAGAVTVLVPGPRAPLDRSTIERASSR